MGRHMRLWMQSLIAAGGCLSLIWSAAAVAQQTLLTRAEVYRLLNQVQFIPRGQSSRPAQLSDILAPRDALRTGNRSRVELLFNEGSLARIGSSAVFRFVPGLRRYQLPDGSIQSEAIFQLRSGVALILNPSDSLGSRIETPESRIELLNTLVSQQLHPPSTPLTLLPPPIQTPVAQGLIPLTLERNATLPKHLTFQQASIKVEPTLVQQPSQSAPLSAPDRISAVVVTHDLAAKTTQVFNLTDFEIRVSNADGSQSKILRAGQTVSVKEGEVGPIQTFDLDSFYQSSEIAAGLGPGQEDQVLQESPEVQAILNAIRVKTVTAVEIQRGWIEGLCTLNGQGNASTLSTNCITTQADDPLSNFQDEREDVTPQPESTVDPIVDPTVDPNPTVDPQPEIPLDVSIPQ
ncbi:MAG: hypothetical protein QNJ46_20680 [Leptolyngbyaceae cyanobacterium MO_188.B28]|nr:hypothetical protein [Leptolyngbyaceae cyanobacterium MO_188.B28]